MSRLCLSVYLPVCLSVRPSVRSVCLPARLPVCLSICPSVRLSVCPSACLSVCLSVFLSPTAVFIIKSSAVPRNCVSVKVKQGRLARFNCSPSANRSLRNYDYVEMTCNTTFETRNITLTGFYQNKYPLNTSLLPHRKHTFTMFQSSCTLQISFLNRNQDLCEWHCFGVNKYGQQKDLLCVVDARPRPG